MPGLQQLLDAIQAIERGLDLAGRAASFVSQNVDTVLSALHLFLFATIDPFQPKRPFVGVGPIQEFTPRFLESRENGAVVRISCTLSQIEEIMGAVNAPILARAANGVCYAYFEDGKPAAEVAGRTRNAIIDFASESQKSSLNLWPAPGADFEIMKRIKAMFDPEHLLNRGRLYNQL